MADKHAVDDGKGFLHTVGQALRLKISAKILIYFLLIALVPLLIVSSVLVAVANNQLLENASAKQQAVATDLSRRVDNYLANDLNQLALLARLYSTRNLTMTQMEQNLATLFSQSATLQQVTMQTSDGTERTLKLQNGSIQITRSKVSNEALGFLNKKSYFISVGRDEKNNPRVTVGIPILKSYGPPTNELFSSQSGTTDQIIGGIAADYNISDLWKSVLSVKIGDGGYAYAVEGSGLLAAHPDRNFLQSNTQLQDVQAVKQFINNDLSTKQTISEKNIEVISTPSKTITGWAVIVQEPVTSIYAGINSYIQLAATIGISAVMLSILAGLFFSRQLIRPLRELTLGARRMEQGNFEQKIDIKTKDEIQDLAETFNQMAQSINKLIGDLRTNNIKLKIEQIKLNNIISSVSDGIIAVNSKGEIISINPPAAELIGKSPDALRGELMAGMFPWRHEERAFVLDLMKGGIYRYSDITLNIGESVAYLDLVVAVLDHQDNDIAAIITIHNQTASRELNFMKLDFVAIAAHELRTPLTVVRGYLDMLNSGSAIKELSVYNLENLSKAIGGADQLRQLINKLLNIARIERGDMEIFLEKLNLSKLVKDNVDQHISAATQREQKINFATNATGNVYVPADSASIVEVLNNLIGNAIKYTGKGGKIQVNLVVEDKMVRVSVSDNGPGVPNELRERLFTKFYRAERSLIAGTRGTGLGLFISKTIIELQGGTIGIEPDKGNGSTFYYTLPIYDPVRDDELIAKKSSGGIRGWFKKRPSN